MNLDKHIMNFLEEFDIQTTFDENVFEQGKSACTLSFGEFGGNFSFMVLF